jgi:hypothetical protein
MRGASSVATVTVRYSGTRSFKTPSHQMTSNGRSENGYEWREGTLGNFYANKEAHN